MMPPAPEHIRQRFSRAAVSYEAAAWHQDRAAERLCHLLPVSLAPRRILEWGCGTGLLTRRLALRWPAAELIALDLAPGMLNQARTAGTLFPGVRWLEADAETYRPDRPVDLLASNCVVQWFGGRDTVGHLAAACVAPGGWVGLCLPVKGTLVEFWQACEDAGVLPQGALPLWDREDCRQAFDLPQWRSLRLWEETLVADRRNAREVLQALRRIGATASRRGDGLQPLSPVALRRVMRAYDDRYQRVDGSVPCSYQLVFLVAQRTEEGSCRDFL